jgi:hypothetical protein
MLFLLTANLKNGGGMKKKDTFPALHKWDLLGKMAPLLHPNGPFVINPMTNIIEVPLDVISKAFETPWVHLKQSNHRRCKIYQDIFVGCLKVLPKQCVNCWKVVFRPQYIKDMLNLIPLMEGLVKKHGFCCKLGCEERTWTSGVYGKWGLWGCYWYNDSKEDGLKCWKIVLDAISADESLRHLLDDRDEDGYPARLVLKRGCTEFELMEFGDSIAWTWTKEAQEWERVVWENLKEQDMSPVQGELIKNHVIDRWFKHAHHAGDPTVMEFNEGTMLWRSTRYYHKEKGGSK